MFPNSLLALVLACSPAQEPDPVIPPQSPPPPHAGATANRLVHETSPYLLQHAYNPVDWHPWGEAALAMARAEDKPIFLSIGYSACHWCHVMERESFEDPEIAAFLKEHFIAIKVDREERPDLDDLYMNAVQRMTGQGGWPMSVFLTPDRKPFYGGTYFPPRAAHGRPGFLDLLQGIAEAWDTRRPELEDAANRLGDSLQIELPAAPATGLPAAPALRRLEASWVAAYRSTYDSVWGGFGSAPKFPRAEDLRWLLAVGAGGELVQAREMALFTLRKMAAGGMYDQIGGGFARYSVDAKWMVPHFEKMLYDQGTLIPAYLDAWRVSGDPEFARIARECCDYLLAERRDPSGGFWSATDADSEGEEGLFFVWTPAQLVETLGEERARFAATLYGVTEKGNFEQGASVLHHGASLAAAAAAAGLESGEPAAVAAEIRAALYAARAERVPPAND
ncbi:MAG TPA: thioredoxin domain-containing protein, partial [Planctomycetota bacterium]